MSRLDWRHFMMLATIRRTGSVSAAARTLGLTQSAASHQVKEAERRLGIPLLARRGRSVVLTQAAEILAETAATCAPLLQMAETKAQELGHGDAPRLRLAFGLQDGLRWAPALFAHLRDRAAPLRLDLIAAGAERPPHLLLQGKAEMAIEIGDLALPDLKRLLIAEDELVCVIGSGHKLAAKKSLAAGDIAGLSYFAHALTPQSGFEFEGFFRPANSSPAHVAHVESLHGIFSLVASGAGVSIQPRSAVAAMLATLPVKAVSLVPRRLYLPWYIHARNIGDGLLHEMADLVRPYIVGSSQRKAERLKD